ncbi:MAG: YkgJ family cysteine cluster protein [Desulfobacterales bacterium]|nr:YkgJ family cysteine cluster protein [Desulfobacterales bacterium]
MLDGMASIEPVRLSLDNKMKFECHQKVKCYTKCCRDIRITLTPYDIVRLKNRLGLSSEEFLTIYTEPHLLEKTDLPIVVLRLIDDDLKSCPFVKESGCIIYEDRPTTCRYYPLGVASLSHKEGVDKEGFYFLINEPHCLGFEERKTMTVREWRGDQGIDTYDEINSGWTDIIVRKRSFPSNIKLTDKSKEMFFLISYNVDKFRRFVFESSFLSLYEVDQETQKAIQEDEIALLTFGFKWLKGVLWKDEGIKMNEEAAAQRKTRK